MSPVLFRNRLDPDNVLSPTSIAWTLQSQTSGWPGYNGYLELLTDPVSQRVILYGVPSGSTSIYSSTMYAYNPATHTFTDCGGNDSLSNSCGDTGPTWPGDRHPVGQMAIDTTRNRLWLWGGVCGGNDWQELWYWTLNSDPTLNAWTRIIPATIPDTLDSGAMIYSAHDDVLYLFGSDGGAQTHTNWVYAPSASLSAAQIAAGCGTAQDWTEVSVVGGTQPTGVAFPRLVYDTVNRRVIQYGGATGGGTVQNQTWSYQISAQTWTRKALSTTTPTLYNGPGSPPTFAMVYLPAYGQYLYHQTHGTGAPRDWVYDPNADTWTVIPSTGNGPTVDAMAAWHPATNTVVTFSNNSGTPDVWHGVVS